MKYTDIKTTTMMDPSSILEALNSQIEVEIDFCDESMTPYVCGQFGNPDTRESIIKTIAETCLSMKLTIAQAIVQVESLYGLNRLD